MLELGRDFDKHARITLPARPCALCGVEYYFLKPHGSGGARRHYCKVCRQAVSSGAVPEQRLEKAPGGPRAPPPKSLPLVMMIFAGLGALMMVLGLAFTMLSTGEDANVANILFGSVTTALGFVLLRKTLRSRSLLMGRRAAAATASPPPGGPPPPPPPAAATPAAAAAAAADAPHPAGGR